MTKTINLTRNALKAKKYKTAKIKTEGTKPISRDITLIASVIKKLIV